MCCPETSVRYYYYTVPKRDLLKLEDGTDRLSQYTVRNIPEERRSLAIAYYLGSVYLH